MDFWDDEVLLPNGEPDVNYDGPGSLSGLVEEGEEGWRWGDDTLGTMNLKTGKATGAVEKHFADKERLEKLREQGPQNAKADAPAATATQEDEKQFFTKV